MAKLNATRFQLNPNLVVTWIQAAESPEGTVIRKENIVVSMIYIVKYDLNWQNFRP